MIQIKNPFKNHYLVKYKIQKIDKTTVVYTQIINYVKGIVLPLAMIRELLIKEYSEMDIENLDRININRI